MEKKTKAMLVVIKLKNKRNFEEMVAECNNLCDAADIEIVQTVTQSSNCMDPNNALRKGKMDEVRQILEETGIRLVVFYNNLHTNVVSNLKNYLGVDVIDRTTLILEIFSMRARSREAKIQTEIAQMKYNLPQLLKDNMDQDKQRGGTFNNRGAGETRSDIIRRAMETRINELKTELKKLENRKDLEYQKRNKSDLKKVALVGYTNAGKSSLMNALLAMNEKEEKSVLEKDQLFATLDTCVRNIRYKKHEFLLFDTVGFVSDLPHELVEAFKSTLKAAVYADLLIHVVDISNPNCLLQQQITLDTLKQISADGIPMICVYNKCDLLKDEVKTDGFFVSCKNKTGLEELMQRIDEQLNPITEIADLLIPYEKLPLVERFRKKGEFVLLENREEGSMYRISSTIETIEQIKKAIN